MFLNQRLFWKILLGFLAVNVFLTVGLSIFWAMQPAPFYPDWDAPYKVGGALVGMAADALEQGGTEEFEQQLALWPKEHRARLTILPLAADNCNPTADPRAIAMRAGQTYCLRYAPSAVPPNDVWEGATASADLLIAPALAGLAFSAALALYLTSPIRELQRGFLRLSRGDMSVRLGSSMGGRRDELADLARHFDGMAARVEELVAARDRLLHDVSHEVRSPLARMQLAIDLLRREPRRLHSLIDRLDREAEHLDALVGELLTLAKLESGGSGAAEYFDLLDILHLVLEDVGFEATAANIFINADLPQEDDEHEWLVLGSGQLVHRAVENVLRNALRFSKAGQTIELALKTSGDGWCTATIEDEGPGISEAGTSDLLLPFVQGRPGDEAGFGLGLAIAQRAIATCGGTMALVNRRTAGLRVTIRLPLAQDLNHPSHIDATEVLTSP